MRHYEIHVSDVSGKESTNRQLTLKAKSQTQNRTHLLEERRTHFPSLSCIIASPDSNCDSQSSGLTAVGFFNRWTPDFRGFLTSLHAEPEELGIAISTCSCVDGSITDFVNHSGVPSSVLLGSVCLCFETLGNWYQKGIYKRTLKNAGYLPKERRIRFSSFSFNIKSPDSNRASKSSPSTAVGLSTE